MLADADDFFNLWLNELDSLARQSERLIRLLKLVEMQISALQLDEDADEDTRASFANYIPLHRRIVTIYLRVQTAAIIADNVVAKIAANAIIDAIDAANVASHIADTVRCIAWAIKHSERQGLIELHDDHSTATYSLASKNDQPAWQTVSQQLLTIFRAHFPAAEYELTEDEASQVTPYLKSTALLLRCLKNAYVSDRAAIEDRLLRPPAPSA